MTYDARADAWRISAEVASHAIEVVRRLQLHAHFRAYLALRRAQRAKRSGDISEIKRFMDDFLRVPGAPRGKPYLRPFNERKPSAENVWCHPNVAGDFAPRSLRTDSPLLQIIEEPRTPYILKADHFRIALETMTRRQRVPVCALAAMLFRDYNIFGEMGHESLIAAFNAEFGIDRDGDEFATLYDADLEFPLRPVAVA